MSDVPEYAQVSTTLKDIEREVKRFEITQKKYAKLHKAVVEANAGSESKSITPKQFNDLKRVYRELAECCKKVGEASIAAKAALEPLQTWQELQEDEEGEAGAGGGRKKAKLSQAGFKDVALPVWLGADTGHVPPPPLCGRVPFPPEARIVPGDLVAANTNALRPKEPPAWILCRVEKFTGSQKRSTYLVTDVAPEEGTTAASFDLPRRGIVPLPKTIPKVWDSNTEFAKGDAVMALFPGTTSFYEAVVIDGPSNTDDKSYMLQFEDDDDEKGQTPVRSIRPAYVVASLRK